MRIKLGNKFGLWIMKTNKNFKMFIQVLLFNQLEIKIVQTKC